MHDGDLDIDARLCLRVNAWIEWRRKLAAREDSEILPQEWMAYDIEGREIATQLLPALWPDAAVYYFSEVRKEYELLKPETVGNPSVRSP